MASQLAPKLIKVYIATNITVEIVHQEDNSSPSKKVRKAVIVRNFPIQVGLEYVVSVHSSEDFVKGAALAIQGRTL